VSRAGAAALLGGALALSGCYRGGAHSVSAAQLKAQDGWQVVDGVPLIRQPSEHECGPAALAMVLRRWGIPADVAQVAQATGGPGQPVAAGALRDEVRRRGLQGFLIRGEVGDLAREVGSNRPVLVGLIQRYTNDRAYAHYEVVVGINARSQQLLLLDPGNGMREDAMSSFSQEWEGAGRLTLVVAPR
jgi:ABC-type bacteriocin/lantibiotic exporter with double-glycine peptidase domain